MGRVSDRFRGSGKCTPLDSTKKVEDSWSELESGDGESDVGVAFNQSEWMVGGVLGAKAIKVSGGLKHYRLFPVTLAENI